MDIERSEGDGEVGDLWEGRGQKIKGEKGKEEK